ncbi:MAG: DNA polymerase III subunit delta [Longimicrobiales bacterium]
MPVVSAERFTQALARGPRGGVYFLYGEEEYLKEAAAQALAVAHVDPATRDFNLDELRGASLDPETLASVCATPPMMAQWRVVIVREAQALATAARARTAIEELLARPMPGLALVLVAQIPDRSKARFWDLLRKKATAVEFAPLAPADLPGWLIARAESDGYALEPSAARALAAAVGAQLGVLVQELDKLVDYAGDRKALTAADVEAVVGRIPRVNRWDWIDAVGERRFAEARNGLATLLGGSETGVGLVIGLGTHFLRLAIGAAGGERALAEALPRHQQFLASRLGRQTRRWSLPALEAALDDLLRADRLLKSASLGDLAVIEELLLRFEAGPLGVAA